MSTISYSMRSRFVNTLTMLTAAIYLYILNITNKNNTLNIGAKILGNVREYFNIQYRKSKNNY